jgi:enediyne biosynthesis protein E4
VLKDQGQSPEFRNSRHWKSPLLDFRLRVQEGGPGKGSSFKSNSFSGNERNRLLMGGENGFVGRSLVSGADCQEDARSFALLDFDQDGWVDIALASCNGPRLRFFRNRFGDLGANGRVVQVILRGSHTGPKSTSGKSNRDAVGAVLTAVSDRRTRTFRKSLGEGLAAQNSERIRITLAEGENLGQLEVRWPSGKVTSLKPLPTQSLLRINE